MMDADTFVRYHVGFIVLGILVAGNILLVRSFARNAPFSSVKVRAAITAGMYLVWGLYEMLLPSSLWVRIDLFLIWPLMTIATGMTVLSWVIAKARALTK